MKTSAEASVKATVIEGKFKKNKAKGDGRQSVGESNGSYGKRKSTIRVSLMGKKVWFAVTAKEHVIWWISVG